MINIDVFGTIASASLYMVLQWNDYKNLSIVVLVALLLFSTRIIIELWKRNRTLKNSRDDELYNHVRAIALKQAARDRDIASLVKQQDSLMSEQVRMKGIDRRVLAVCVGDDNEMEKDLVAIRQSWEVGDYVAIQPLTKKRFANSLLRQRSGRRKSDRAVRYLHFAVHSSHDGLLFNDGMVDAAYLSNYLRDIECIVVNGCNSDVVSDLLIGLSKYVISLSDEIEHEWATLFCGSFWGYIADGVDIEEAYYSSLKDVPRSVAEHAVLHTTNIQ